VRVKANLVRGARTGHSEEKQEAAILGDSLDWLRGTQPRTPGY